MYVFTEVLVFGQQPKPLKVTRVSGSNNLVKHRIGIVILVNVHIYFVRRFELRIKQIIIDSAQGTKTTQYT